MPYLNIKTNQKIESETVISEISSFMAGLLKKPERVMMVSLSSNMPMIFAGQLTPTAFVQLKSIGLTAEQSKDIAPKMNAFLGSVLNISEDRIYIDMQDIDRKMFAFNGQTFA
jgi:phenylpyruvate tautomerase PptA (4-oxalocrotonate tautomerase family)